jgi:hypothetical protein
MKAAWLKRFDEMVFDPSEFQPSVTIRSLTDLATEI